MDTALRCLNCGKQVSEDQAKLFAHVYVCYECYTLAERYYKRLERELMQLMVLAHESIRESLTRGQFHPTHTSRDEIPKRELLQHIGRLCEVNDEVRRDSPTGQ